MPSRRSLRTLLNAESVDAEMDAEMRAHVDMESRERIERGEDPVEARRNAAVAFGGVLRRREEAIDDMRGAWLVNLRRDVRIAIRTLARYRTFTTTAVLALALAIAVNTTTFSVIDAMIHPYVGIAHPDRLYAINYWASANHGLFGSGKQQELPAHSKAIAAVTEFSGGGWRGTTIERGRQAVDHASVATVRPNFFPALDVSAIQGKLVPGAGADAIASTVVISEHLRSSLFADSENALGSVITLEGRPFTIIGVVRSYAGIDALNAEVWRFFDQDNKYSTRVVRLNSGIAVEAAARELTLLAAQRALAAGNSPGTSRYELKPLPAPFELKQFHYALIGSGIAILIIACTNLANLQLARGLTRSAEIAVRSALGASRRQIIAQLFIENAVIATMALLLALCLTAIGIGIIRATIPADFKDVGNYIVKPRGSWRMIVVAALTTTVCLLSVGLLPSLRISRVNLNATLKGRSGTGAHRSNRRVYGALVIVQIALTLPLATAAVLMSRSAAHTADIDYVIHEFLGYDPRQIIDIVVTSGGAQPKERHMVQLTDVATRFEGVVRGIPGVSDAALSIPSYTSNAQASVDDIDGSFRDVEDPMGGYTRISPSYLRVMGRPIRRGTDFTSGEYTEPLVIVDMRSAKYLWPHSNPIGRSIRFASKYNRSPGTRSARVIGVVGDFLSDDARANREMMSTSRLGEMFRVMTTADSISIGGWSWELSLKARIHGDIGPIVIALRERLRAVSSSAPIVRPEVEALGLPQRARVLSFVAGLFTVFGILALGLSALGVYAIVAQSVTDRQREVAVRIALGSTPRAIIRALIREGVVLVLAGVAIGLFLIKETVGWIGPFMMELDAYNAPLFALLSLSLFAAMAMAALGPARRATKLDPMEVLRAE